MPQSTIDQLLADAEEMARLYREAHGTPGFNQDSLPPVDIHPEGGVILPWDER